MDFTYPTPLIERTVRYFKQKYRKDISHATAVEYLDQLADLHSSFIELLQPDENNRKELLEDIR